MSADMDTDDDVVLLLCLRSGYDEAIDMETLSSVGMSVYEFDNADELIDHLTALSTAESFIFVWLGRGWNHLLVILNEFAQISYIYLSEPSEERCIPKIRGVFTGTAELSQQVFNDARACQLNQSTHLEVLDKQETPVIGNQRGIVARVMWSQTLLQGLLHVPRPAVDVHREMLAEARHFYRKNPAQLAKIDDFEQNYRAGDAIRWYSYDSFTYRLMNKALRIQNLAVIYKFRFFIGDVHEQLEKLHQEQNLSTHAKAGEDLGDQQWSLSHFGLEFFALKNLPDHKSQIKEEVLSSFGLFAKRK